MKNLKTLTLVSLAKATGLRVKHGATEIFWFFVLRSAFFVAFILSLTLRIPYGHPLTAFSFSFQLPAYCLMLNASSFSRSRFIRLFTAVWDSLSRFAASLAECPA